MQNMGVYATKGMKYVGMLNLAFKTALCAFLANNASEFVTIYLVVHWGTPIDGEANFSVPLLRKLLKAAESAGRPPLWLDNEVHHWCMSFRVQLQPVAHDRTRIVFDKSDLADDPGLRFRHMGVHCIQEVSIAVALPMMMPAFLHRPAGCLEYSSASLGVVHSTLASLLVYATLRRLHFDLFCCHVTIAGRPISLCGALHDARASHRRQEAGPDPRRSGALPLPVSCTCTHQCQ